MFQKWYKKMYVCIIGTELKWLYTTPQIIKQVP